MATRLLVTGAGTGASNNLIRSLRAGDPSLVVVGSNADRFVLRNSPADRNYLVHPPTHAHFLGTLRRVVKRERIDLLIPTTDLDVRVLSRLRARIPCRLFLPRAAVIDICQDKYALTSRLRSRGIPAPLTYPVSDLDRLEELFHRLAPHRLVWCRIRTGSGSRGAILVKSPEQARGWISYWEEMRGVPATAFTLSEYLPGRDFGAQSLWHAGRPILIKAFERLSAFTGGGEPSGVSSVAALARTVFEPRVAEVCTESIRALDARASGVYCFDLREDAQGAPCLTEINAGRFSMSTNLHDLTGKHNMAVTYVRLALGEPVEVRAEHEAAEEHYLVRDLDTIPGIFSAEDVLTGIHDART